MLESPFLTSTSKPLKDTNVLLFYHQQMETLKFPRPPQLTTTPTPSKWQPSPIGTSLLARSKSRTRWAPTCPCLTNPKPTSSSNWNRQEVSHQASQTRTKMCLNHSMPLSLSKNFLSKSRALNNNLKVSSDYLAVEGNPLHQVRKRIHWLLRKWARVPSPSLRAQKSLFQCQKLDRNHQRPLSITRRIQERS